MAEAKAPKLKTKRTTVKRRPQRGSYDWDTLAGILDEGIVCHIGFNGPDGQPYVVPTGYGRDGRVLYLHGSSASRMLKTLKGGVPMCFTVTLLDGLVLARSAFHHSMNYRSVMVLGTAREVNGEEKLRALQVITEHMVRGRWEDVRKPTALEMKATSVLRLDIEEASAKVRGGGPLGDDEDMDLGVWAGVLPFKLVAGRPVPDTRLPPDGKPPAYLKGYRRPEEPLPAK
jgi:hypothetical protein